MSRWSSTTRICGAGSMNAELTRSPPARPRKIVTDCIAPPGRRKLRQSRSFPTKFLRHPPMSVRLVRATGGMPMRRSVKAILIARLFIGDLMMMTRTKILLAAGAAVLIGGVALAGTSFAERGFGHHGMRMGMMMGVGHQLLENVDTNDDGALSQAEIDAAVNGRFTEFDANTDGELSLDEFQALWAEITKPDRGARVPVPRPGRRCGDRQGRAHRPLRLGRGPLRPERRRHALARGPAASRPRPGPRIGPAAAPRQCGAAPCGRIA